MHVSASLFHEEAACNSGGENMSEQWKKSLIKEKSHDPQ